MAETGDLSNLRKEYLQSGIIKEDLSQNPIEQFSLWFSQAMEANIIEPSAMSLATSDDSIGIRTVLLKYFDERGFVFFTNYESKKSKQLQNNPQAAILFPWLALERQVKIIGSVEKITTLSAVGYAVVSSQPGRTDAQKRLMAIRSARMAAMRELAEQIHGIQVDSNTTVIDLMVQNDTFRAVVKGIIRGAKTVRINPTGVDTYETVLEIDKDMMLMMLRNARRT